MSLTVFAFKILFIFLPGLIALIIIENLIEHKGISNFRFSIYAFILGTSCYLIYYSIIKLFYPNKIFFLLNIIYGSKQPIVLSEILYPIVISFILGFIMSIIINRKLFYKFASKIRFSNKIGEVDIFTAVINSAKSEWIVIRDIENNLMFEGWVQFYSCGIEQDELFLRDVCVYDNKTGAELYSSPGIFFNNVRNRKNCIIEFSGLQFTKDIDREENKENGE